MKHLFSFRVLAACILAASLSARPVAAAATVSPEVPGAPQSKPLVLVNAVIHPVSGPVIERGSLLIVDGKISAIGLDLTVPEGADQLDLAGKHVYPGLFDAATSLGLIEIESVRATLDQSETGNINTNVRAEVAVNPDSEHIPVARSNGVLTVMVTPAGGLFAGKAAVMHTDGWTWEEMTLRAPAAMVLNWPFEGGGGRRFRFRGGQQPGGAEEPQQSAVDRLREILQDARAYGQAQQAAAVAGSTVPAPEHDLRLEALLPVLSGALPVAVMADDVRQIEAAVAFSVEQKLKIIIVGGYDAPRCADLLKQHQIPVVVTATHRLPRRRGDAYDTAFAVPSLLHEQGIKFCIASDGQAAFCRNLPYQAASAAAYGLPPEEALKAVTQYPAEILGVAERLGTLEPGKDATLIVTDGDPLEIPTHVEYAYIQGRAVDLSDRHKRLYRKYEEKYRRLGIPQSE